MSTKTTTPKYRPGPVNCSLQPWIADDGTPFLAYCTLKQTPHGVKIVGNGTLPHPLDVKLEGPYAVAPILLKELRAAFVELADLHEAHVFPPGDEEYHHPGSRTSKCPLCRQLNRINKLIKSAEFPCPKTAKT